MGHLRNETVGSPVGTSKTRSSEAPNDTASRVSAADARDDEVDDEADDDERDASGGLTESEIDAQPLSDKDVSRLVQFYQKVARREGHDAAFKAVMSRAESWSDDPSGLAQIIVARARPEREKRQERKNQPEGRLRELVELFLVQEGQRKNKKKKKKTAKRVSRGIGWASDWSNQWDQVLEALEGTSGLGEAISGPSSGKGRR